MVNQHGLDREEKRPLIHQDFECEFYFIRHGESQSNASPGFVAGIDFDSPLTNRGFVQARRLGERLKREGRSFDRVYSSSLIRAVQTTETMLEAMGEGDRPFPRVDALIEQQMPGWRGLRVDEVYTPELVAYLRTKASHFVPPEGESHRMVQRRVSGWIEDEIVYNEEVVASVQSLTVAVVGPRCGDEVSDALSDGIRRGAYHEDCARQLLDNQVPLRQERLVAHLHKRQLPRHGLLTSLTARRAKSGRTSLS